MLSLYLFSVLVGGVLLATAAFGGGQDHDPDPGLDHPQFDTNAAKFFSLRTLTYFLFVFGGVGAALSWGSKGVATIIVLPLALAAGLGVAGLVGFTFRYLAQTDSGSRNGEESFVGLQGRIVLPIGENGIGKIAVLRGDRFYELIARPLDASAGGTGDWKSIVVVEMQRGTAIIAPLDDAVLTQGS